MSYSNLPEMKRYIVHQAEHHHQRSFQETFIAFLERHDIPRDAHYLRD